MWVLEKGFPSSTPYKLCGPGPCTGLSKVQVVAIVVVKLIIAFRCED